MKFKYFRVQLGGTQNISNYATADFKMNIKCVYTLKQNTLQCTYREQSGISYLTVKTSCCETLGSQWTPI